MKSIIVTDETHTALRLAAIASEKQIGELADSILAAECAKIQAKAAKKAAKTPAKSKP